MCFVLTNGGEGTVLLPSSPPSSKAADIADTEVAQVAIALVPLLILLAVAFSDISLPLFLYFTVLAVPTLRIIRPHLTLQVIAN